MANMGGQDGVIRIRNLMLLAGRREHDWQPRFGVRGLQCHPLYMSHGRILLLMQPASDEPSVKICMMRFKMA